MSASRAEPPNWRWRAGSVEPGPAIVFDLDGVLSDAAGRQHYLEYPRRDWEAFFQACGDDELIDEVARLLELLDEHLLIPGRHPVLTAEPTDGDAMEIRYRDRLYRIPVEEVIVLPISNTSAENLAAWFGRTLRERMRPAWPQLRVQCLSVGIEETPGQRGVWTLRE